MSREYRFFVESLTAEVVELPADQAHHAANVLRLADGQEVEVFDGAGGAAGGALQFAEHGRATVRIVARRPARPRPEPVVELAFAIPKGKRLDWLLEKAAELGAAKLVPVICRRGVVRPEGSRHALDRWRGICIAVAKQCGLDFLPEISAPVELGTYVAGAPAEVKLFGSADAASSLRQALEAWSPGKRIAVLVGPEGGLTEQECAAAQASGFAPVRLGSLTLRVETAAVALLAAARTLL